VRFSRSHNGRSASPTFSLIVYSRHDRFIAAETGSRKRVTRARQVAGIVQMQRGHELHSECQQATGS
jgi:hypothetical protein